MRTFLVCVLFLSALAAERAADAQDDVKQQPADQANSDSQKANSDSQKDGEPKSTESIQEKVDDVADKVNQDERAQAAAAGILKPIYQLAERFSFSSFHWIAFALMATGVVAFALQLVIGKLLLIFRMELDLGEILSDVMGLAISVIGLVLTTQAATENSKFAQNAVAVLSASAVGLVLGFIFFRIGFGSEARAAKVRK